MAAPPTLSANMGEAMAPSPMTLITSCWLSPAPSASDSPAAWAAMEGNQPLTPQLINHSVGVLGRHTCRAALLSKTLAPCPKVATQPWQAPSAKEAIIVPMTCRPSAKNRGGNYSFGWPNLLLLALAPPSLQVAPHRHSLQAVLRAHAGTLPRIAPFPLQQINPLPTTRHVDNELHVGCSTHVPQEELGLQEGGSCTA